MRGDGTLAPMNRHFRNTTSVLALVFGLLCTLPGCSGEESGGATDNPANDVAPGSGTSDAQSDSDTQSGSDPQSGSDVATTADSEATDSVGQVMDGGAADSTPSADAGPASATDSAIAKPPVYPLDDVLRVNHMQVKGTHNSYHLKMGKTVLPPWDYEFDPLPVQLAKQGVRQLELDVHYKPGKPKATWEVLHVPFVDAKSSCKTLTVCLQLTKTWSDSNPGHHLLFILIEPKDDIDTNKIVGHYDELDAAILAVWPKDRVLRPDDVRGKHPTLRKALLADGWPTLGATRNKAMFVMLNSGHHRANYLKGHPNLEDRVIFMRDGKGESWAAVLEMGGPEGDKTKIQDAVKAGYLVRTKADDPNASDAANEKRAKAAIASGAQLISSDFPAKVKGKSYIFSIPGGTPTGCNPLTAPKKCTGKAIEAL